MWQLHNLAMKIFPSSHPKWRIRTIFSKLINKGLRLILKLGLCSFLYTFLLDLIPFSPAECLPSSITNGGVMQKNKKNSVINQFPNKTFINVWQLQLTSGAQSGAQSQRQFPFSVYKQNIHFDFGVQPYSSALTGGCQTVLACRWMNQSSE